jgi:glycosyltransferase involved in cell wall biosynthesis
MNIGLLIYGSLSNRSGGYLYDRMLEKHLRAAGDKIEVISLSERDYLRYLGDNYSPSLMNRLVDLDVDILLQDELNHPSLFHLNYSLQKKVSFPIVSIVHHLRSSESHPRWQKQIYRWIESRYINSVDGIIFNSHATRQTVESLMINEMPWVVAYPSGNRLNVKLSQEKIISRAIQAGALRLIFLGNIIPRKGLDLLLMALSFIPKEQWSLYVVGSLEMDPTYVESIKNLVIKFGLEDQVKFTGFLENMNLSTVMVDSQVLVVPSQYEGFGIAYLEGMGFGLPAIATTGGGAVEIISHGKDGFLIPPGEINQLVYYLCRLVDERDLLTRMSLAARERYLQHPPWSETSANIREFLKGVVQNRRQQ